MPQRTPSSFSGCVRCGLDSTAFVLLLDMQQNVPFSGFALASVVMAREHQRRHTYALTHWAELTASHRRHDALPPPDCLRLRPQEGFMLTNHLGYNSHRITIRSAISYNAVIAANAEQSLPAVLLKLQIKLFMDIGIQETNCSSSSELRIICYVHKIN
ncbi:unnamed protein product [Urochloa humidicola]